MEKLRYKKIRDFLEGLNEREQNYLYRKLKEEIIEKEIEQVNFTINGKQIA